MDIAVVGDLEVDSPEFNEHVKGMSNAIIFIEEGRVVHAPVCNFSDKR